jgi:hypothetical protein
MEEHAHCAACGKVLPASIKEPGGIRHPVTYDVIQELRVVSINGDLVQLEIPKPGCAECVAAVKEQREELDAIAAETAAEEARKAAGSRLIVARGPGLPV